MIPIQAHLLNLSINSFSNPRFEFFSSASPEPKSDDPAKINEEGHENPNEEAKVTDQAEQAKPADQTKESGSISESQSSMSIY